jgi:proteasome accessory factor B
MDKLERLLTLTATLLETPRALTAEELRQRVPGYPDGLAAFRRSFERDKEDLREMGIPITVEVVEDLERPVEGYRIRRADYELADPGLDPDELAALNLAAAVVRVEGVEGVEALWKLGGAVVEPGATGTLAALPAEPALVPVFGAVVDRRTLSFRYRGAARTAERVVDPHRLDYQRGRWYLSGVDHDRGEPRVFRLDRIEGDVVAGEAGAFDPPPSPAGGVAPAWELGGGEVVTARLLVDADLAPWTRRHLGEGTTAHPRPDGSAVFEVAVANWPAFRSFVLSFLDHAELLDPPDLRAELVAWLEALAGAGAR